jgi:hypothetical protein
VTPANPPAREEKVEALRDFSRDLAEICRRCDPNGGQTAQALSAALTVECVKCGIRVSGAELLAISAAADEANTSPKVKRMRLGYCARDTCEGLAYRIHFSDLPGFAWQAVYGLAETANCSRRELAAAEAAAALAQKRQVRRRYLMRVAVALGALVLLFVLRQWYTGGRIPIVREPEKFHVAPLTDEHKEDARE